MEPMFGIIAAVLIVGVLLALRSKRKKGPGGDIVRNPGPNDQN